MIEKIEIYLVQAVFFFLLFLGLTLLFDRYKKKGPQHRYLKKIPWNTVIKIFCVWVAILVCRKLIFYIPLIRTMQTKDTLIWLDERILFALFVSLFFIPLLIVSSLVIRKILNKDASKEDMQVQSSESDESGCSPIIILLVIWIPFITFVGEILKGIEEKTLGKTLLLAVTAPLVLVKMVSSGKYVGLLAGLVAASYIIDRHTRYREANKVTRVKLFIVPVLVIIGIFISGYFRFTGNWQERLLHRARTAKSTRAYEELIDAVNTVRVHNWKNVILKDIGLTFANRGKVKWSEDFFQQAIDSAGSIEDESLKFKALTAIGAAIAETGDSRGVLHSIEPIKDKKAKFQAYREIAAAVSTSKDKKNVNKIIVQWIDLAMTMDYRENVPVNLSKIAVFVHKTGDKKRSKEIFQQALDAAESIKGEDRNAGISALIEIARALGETGEHEWEREILQQSATAAGKLAYDFQKTEIYNQIAEAVAGTGDLKWSKELFQYSVAAVEKLTVPLLQSRALIKNAAGLLKIGEVQWAKEVLQKALNAAAHIHGEWMKAPIFTKIAAEILKTGEIEWAKKVLQQALDAAETINDEANKASTFKEIALLIAKTGDKKQASSIAKRISLEWIKNKTLKEIRKIR